MADRSILLDLEAAGSFRFSTRRGLSVRAAGDGDDAELQFEGWACVTGHPYEMYGGAPYGWSEIVARGAFAKTLNEQADVQLLVNHAGLPLARTKSGTLSLDEDDIGLHTRANLDPADPDVSKLAGKMRRGDIDEMSFAFRVVRQRWEDDEGNEAESWNGTVRRILEISLHKGDVSVVNYGANDATSANVRDIDRAFAELRAGRTLPCDQVATLRALLDSPPAPPAPPAPAGMSIAEARRLAL